MQHIDGCTAAVAVAAINKENLEVFGLLLCFKMEIDLFSSLARHTEVASGWTDAVCVCLCMCEREREYKGHLWKYEMQNGRECAKQR